MPRIGARSVPPVRSAVAVVMVGVLLAVGCAAVAPRPSMKFDHPTKRGPRVPLAVYIHGGGWVGGDRVSDAYYLSVKPQLLAQGIAVASIDYKLAPRHRFPAQIRDVTYAVRYLRASAKKLRIDPNRIAAFGTSAGGHLAALVGTIDKSAGFDVGTLPGVSSRVRAVASIVGISDLTDPSFPSGTDAGIQAAFGAPGGTPAAPALTRFSPVTYVTPDDPTFLIVHGTRDELVPYRQAVTLAQRLKAAGVAAELVTVEGGTHGLVTPGQSVSPEQITVGVTGFLVRELRR